MLGLRLSARLSEPAVDAGFMLQMVGHFMDPKRLAGVLDDPNGGIRFGVFRRQIKAARAEGRIAATAIALG